jgi:hypothetical protein
VSDCKVMDINSKKILVSCSADESFTLFDYEKRQDGCPKFIQKYGTLCEPTQI